MEMLREVTRPASLSIGQLQLEAAARWNELIYKLRMKAPRERLDAVNEPWSWPAKDTVVTDVHATIRNRWYCPEARRLG